MLYTTFDFQFDLIRFRKDFSVCTHRGTFSESRQIKPNLASDYNTPIDLAPYGIPIGTKSIGEKCNYTPSLVRIDQISEVMEGPDVSLTTPLFYPRSRIAFVREIREILYEKYEKFCTRNYEKFCTLRREVHSEIFFEILLNQTEMRLYLPCTD